MGAVYIHIPFCIKKCLYCDFVSYECPEMMPQYIAVLKKEIDLAADRGICSEPIDTLFIGGGTPSLMDGAQAAELLSCVRHHFSVRADAEITMECNPCTVTERKLNDYRTAGVNRLSFGVQSMDDRVLQLIGRRHRRADACSALKWAVSAGFTNINADMMYGLPGQDLHGFKDSLLQLLDLGRDLTHISLYSLILEDCTPMKDLVDEGKLVLPEEDLTCDMQDLGIELLNKRGFERYEISNYAKPGMECRHNLTYWDNGTYLGFGAAAHGSLIENGQRIRTENHAALKGYMNAVYEGQLPRRSVTVIGQREEMFETVMLSLRTIRGLELMRFRERYGIAFEEAYPNTLSKLIRRDLCTVSGGFAALTNRGLDIQNSVLLMFMEEAGLS